jgi:O-antigen/teichoic acid export membrane protein
VSPRARHRLALRGRLTLPRRAQTADPPAPTEQPPRSLKEEVLHGGRLLLIRQGLGLVVSVGGVLLLTRLIGPSDYGLYAAAFSFAFFAQATGELSLDVYLVRREGELTDEVCDQVFTLLSLLAVATVAITLALAPLLSSGLRLHGFEPIEQVMFLSIPLMQLQQVHLSRLERTLDYRSIGVVELAAQIAFFAVAVVLAAAFKAGAWAPVAGWWTQQALLAAGFWRSDRYRPRLRWRGALVREILTYGAVMTAANFVYSLRNLVAPILIGRTLGAAAIGYVALAERVSIQLGVAQQLIFRISISVLGRISTERDRLQRAMTQGAELQLLAAGIPITVFSMLAAVLVPIVFGTRWLPVATLIPLLAPPCMAAAFFNLEFAALALRRRPWELVVAQGSGALLMWVGAVVFVPLAGVRGYGYAELLAIAAWLVTDHLVARNFLRPQYRFGLIWWAALSAAALAPVTSWWLVLAVPACLLMPGSAREIRGVAWNVLRVSAAPAGATG